MPRSDSTQFNLRSRFARTRARELAERTGMTTTRIVEEALKAFDPEPRTPNRKPAPHGLIWKGPILVKPATGRTITLRETLDAIEAGRIERE